MVIFNKSEKEYKSTGTAGTVKTEGPAQGAPARRTGGNAASESTTISEGATLNGRIDVKCELLIDGEVNAEIHSTGTVKIGQAGSVTGDIYASTLIVSGNFNGNADCEKIELIAGGKVEGKLTSVTLTIDSHSSFEGQSIRKGQGPKPSAPPRPAAAPPASSAEKSN